MLLRLRRWFFKSLRPAPVLLIRLMVGWVFLFEGIQKFLYPAALGVGRFEKIGIRGWLRRFAVCC